MDLHLQIHTNIYSNRFNDRNITDKLHKPITIISIFMKKLLIPVSIGELYDKLTILSIKHEKITDPIKHATVETEIRYLQDIIMDIDMFPPSETRLVEKLRTINAELWEMKYKIRRKECKRQFDREFIELARSLYKMNDERNKIKNEINKIFDAEKNKYMI